MRRQVVDEPSALGWRFECRINTNSFAQPPRQYAWQVTKRSKERSYRKMWLPMPLHWKREKLIDQDKRRQSKAEQETLLAGIGPRIVRICRLFHVVGNNRNCRHQTVVSKDGCPCRAATRDNGNSPSRTREDSRLRKQDFVGGNKTFSSYTITVVS